MIRSKPEKVAELDAKMILVRVFHMRMQRSVSVEKAAAHLGLTSAQFRELETVPGLLTIPQIVALKDLYGTTLHWLLLGRYREMGDLHPPRAYRDEAALLVGDLVSSIPTAEAKAAAIDAVQAILDASRGVAG